MSTLPRREKPAREAIEVEVGDFSHDRIYPDLNPELVGEEKLPTEEEYYANLAQRELAWQEEQEEQDKAADKYYSGEFAFE